MGGTDTFAKCQGSGDHGLGKVFHNPGFLRRAGRPWTTGTADATGLGTVTTASWGDGVSSLTAVSRDATARRRPPARGG
ncbi:protein of unknown function (plasmid) [Azospirillum baldaniorum]|uniref:Uncharacterized protein n=1 Tax=Azospirillum baldaniorum TaxID=1064539 RepID=A0A9P1JZC3_9PROT|nr:protein of unknown function [Azospirillum baldaniorum]